MSRFSYQEFHASLNDKSELETTNAVAPRHEWINDTYKHEIDGKKVDTQVSDPYQWLEDPDSGETKEWIDCQVDMCNHFLDSIYAPSKEKDKDMTGGDAESNEISDLMAKVNQQGNNNNNNNNNNSNNGNNIKGSNNNNDDEDNSENKKLLRKQIASNLKENLKFGRYSTPYRKKDYYFYRYNEGTWNQSKLYVLPKDDTDSYLQQLREKKNNVTLSTDEDHVLIDPNTLAKDGTSQLKSLYHSKNGELMAYSVSKKGSDWVEIHLKNVKQFVDNIGNNKKGNELKTDDEEQIDVLKHCKFSSVTWTHDNKGFFYTRYSAPQDAAAVKKDKKEAKTDDKTDKSLGTETSQLSNQQLYYHKCGDFQKNDVFIIDAKTLGDEKWLIGHGITWDGKYFIISLSSDCDPVNRVYACQRGDKGVIKAQDGTKSILDNMVKLVDNFDAGYDYVTNEGSLFYFKTNYLAPNYRVIRIDIGSKNTLNCIKNGSKLEWEEVIKETDCRLEVANCVGKTTQYLYLDYTKDVKTQLYLTDMNGLSKPYLINKVKDIYDIDGGGSNESKQNEDVYFPAHGCLGGWGNRHFDEGFIYFESWLHPGSIYHFNFNSKELLLFLQIKPKNFDADLYETEQIYFRYKTHPIVKNSIRHNRFEIIKASTNKSDLLNDRYKQDELSNIISPIIPMYILYKRELMDSESHGPFNNKPIPTQLYGYGGFDISLLPNFRATRLCWLQNFNGIYAIANIRGGGEYGESWHKQGQKCNKQNVFNDFQAAATCLIDNLKYTDSNNLIIEGGSNGGLLVAACCNQRPDLFRCGIAHVGVLDMLKFHKFTIGYAWTSDFGSADESKSEFDYLYDYSPLHNIPNPNGLVLNDKKDGVLLDNILQYGKTHEYPCFLALTADHDDRVVPLHSFKFMAELQYTFRKYKKQKNPLLIRIDVSAGHGGSSLTKAIDNRADVYTFLAKCLNLEWKDDDCDGFDMGKFQSSVSTDSIVTVSMQKK